MGYTTDFAGQFDLDRPLAPEHKAYLEAFNNTRRTKREVAALADVPDPIREAAGLPLGPEGAFYVAGGFGCAGEPAEIGQMGHGDPPEGQPSLYCQWAPADEVGDTFGTSYIPNEDAPATSIVWDGGEKFYEYVAWLEYLIENFLKPWGYVLNGEVEWKGEQSDDIGKIVVDDNVVTTRAGRVVYYGEE